MPTKKAKTKRARRRKSAPQARYEAASTNYFDRSCLPAALQDARFDADSSTRMELVRRSRYWERNNAIVNRLADVFEQYTVGPEGLQVIPTGEDEDWISSASRWYGDWCKFPEVMMSLPMSTLQSIMARTWFIDGEVFVYKTFSPVTGRPRIQLIEGHRISTPPHLKGEEGKSIIDGIEFAAGLNGQPQGRPLRYWVRTDDGPGMPSRTTAGQWDSIDGQRLIHLHEPTRPGMFRGLPFLYPVMNDLHDLDDLQLLEMKAAKVAAEVANVITNRTGEANLTSSRRARWNIQTMQDPANRNPPLFYETTLGGRTVFVNAGEKFEQFKSDRPGVATREHWDYLVRKICAGVGISSMLVLPFSMQGTVTRADLDVAAAFFRSRSSLISTIVLEIYLWALGWAVNYDRSLDGAPDGWWRAIVRPPRSVNVDVGRNSNAIIEELEAGIRTYQDVCAEMGMDWRHALRQKAIEAAYIDNLAVEFKTKRERIAQLAKESLTTSIVEFPEGQEHRGPGRPPKEDDDKKQTAKAEAEMLREWHVRRDDAGNILGYQERFVNK